MNKIRSAGAVGVLVVANALAGIAAAQTATFDKTFLSDYSKLQPKTNATGGTEFLYVAPGAQKADGYQANRNLVLSRGARADSIPGLEILADDVRCTHGATVGQLDDEQIFYLMSRGMPRAEAEKVVVDGFFDPVLQRIPFEGVRERLKRAIEAKMG